MPVRSQMTIWPLKVLAGNGLLAPVYGGSCAGPVPQSLSPKSRALTMVRAPSAAVSPAPVKLSGLAMPVPLTPCTALANVRLLLMLLAVITQGAFDGDRIVPEA